jgi:pimeloyl-ACP methyl ester carboxylesterase
VSSPEGPYRGGRGEPLVLLHGASMSWRAWRPVLSGLEGHHDVLVPTMIGHRGGAPWPEGEPVGVEGIVDDVESLMDAAGMPTAHLVGNSLGGHVALRLAARGRARTVVALAPAGGWGDDSSRDLLRFQATLVEQTKAAAPYADALVATPEGRRRATRYLTTNFEHIPAELLAHQLRAVAASSESALAMIHVALREGWSLDAEHITCPVRIVWGTDDRLLPWPAAAARFRTQWLPHADWVELDGVGHAPQLDVPLETAQLILGFTA